MTNTAIDLLLKSCDLLQQRTIWAHGFMHSSAKCFNACMRQFDRAECPAEAITFRIFFNAPIMKEGRARIYRDGHMEMWTGTEEYEA